MSEISLLKKLRAAWPPPRWRGERVLVAVSGGADSVALVRGLVELREESPAGPGDGGALEVLHFHHRLRGGEADADAEFVRVLAADLNLPCYLGEAEEGIAERTAGRSLEGALREARYRFFTDEAQRRGARFVLTAHTADDQVETVLHRVLRGTGLAGLAGIPSARLLCPHVSLVRPLLGAARAEVLEYLRARKQPWRHDSSNDELDFTRNRLRHDLLPRLRREYNAEFDAALLRLAELARENREFLATHIENLVAAGLVRRDSEQLVLNAARLAGESPYLVRETLRHLWREQDWPLQNMTHAHWRRLAGLAQGGEGAGETFPGGVAAACSGGRFTLRRAAASKG